MRGLVLPVVAVGLALAAPAARAQQFDNFGGGPLQGFEVDPDALEGTEVPSLSQDGVLTPGTGPEITLELGRNDGQVGLSVFPGTGSAVTSISQPQTQQATRVTLRALDRMLGRPTDVELSVGETVMYGRIAIRAVECRFPVEDPGSDAFAHLEILDDAGATLFDGWMVASSPALNALEHARYDVWVLRCSAD